MTYVMITVYDGLIDNVTFFQEARPAIIALSEYVKSMNVEHNDAALYDSNGLVANAKHFLDDHDRYCASPSLIEEVAKEISKTIYIIGNPSHHLGFMVASPDDPLGYKDPVEALAVLEQMREDFGRHLKLYQVLPVEGKIATLTDLKEYYKGNDIDDCGYSNIEEYLL